MKDIFRQNLGSNIFQKLFFLPPTKNRNIVSEYSQSDFTMSVTFTNREKMTFVNFEFYYKQFF